ASTHRLEGVCAQRPAVAEAVRGRRPRAADARLGRRARSRSGGAPRPARSLVHRRRRGVAQLRLEAPGHDGPARHGRRPSARMLARARALPDTRRYGMKIAARIAGLDRLLWTAAIVVGSSVVAWPAL